MKIEYVRAHTTRPEDYESVLLSAKFIIDTESEADAEFADMDMTEIGEELSARADELLDTDVDRTLRLDGQHIDNSHLWAFYEKD